MREKYTIRVTLKDFVIYNEKNVSSYLDKKNGYEINAPSKSNLTKKIFNIKTLNEEIFEGTKVEYSVINQNDNYTLIFESSNGNKYRIDLIIDIDNKKLYHIGFSLINRTEKDYEIKTVLEPIEVFFKSYLYSKRF